MKNNIDKILVTLGNTPYRETILDLELNPEDNMVAVTLPCRQLGKCMSVFFAEGESVGEVNIMDVVSTEVINQGWITFEDFVKFLDDIPKVENYMFSNEGGLH